MLKPQALLLDAGNTIVFLDVECVAAVLGDGALTVSSDALRTSLPHANRAYMEHVSAGAAHEEGWTYFMSTLLRSAGVAKTDVPRAVDLVRAEHDRFNLWRRVPEALLASLATLRARGVRLGVISNSEGKLDELFRHVGLDEVFEVVVDSHIEGVRKPDPVIFRRACERLRLAPSECLYAGDLPAIDVVGARGAGLDAVLIDAFGIYPDYQDAPRFASVADLCAAIGAEP